MCEAPEHTVETPAIVSMRFIVMLDGEAEEKKSACAPRAVSIWGRNGQIVACSSQRSSTFLLSSTHTYHLSPPTYHLLPTVTSRYRTRALARGGTLLGPLTLAGKCDGPIAASEEGDAQVSSYSSVPCRR